jgi:TRAP transporter TAXI family solute receptor
MLVSGFARGPKKPDKEGTMTTNKRKSALWYSLAALAAATIGGSATAESTATIVGAGPGAGAYQLAGALAENVNRLKLDLIVTNRASKGFVANTRMVEVGGADFAMTSGPFVFAAQRGLAPYPEMKATKIRGVGPVTTSWFQMAVLSDSGIKTYMDLKGKRVNYAEKGSNTEFMTRTIMEQLGIDGDVQKEYMRWDQAATAMTDGNIAAFGIPNPVPSPSILQASASAPLRILSVPDKVIDHFIGLNPGYYKDTVPPGSYTGMENESFTTFAYMALVTTNADVAEDIVYKVTKATYDAANREFMLTAMRAWRIGLDATKDNRFIEQMAAFGLELHPGAARYWQERGLIN